MWRRLWASTNNARWVSDLELQPNWDPQIDSVQNNACKHTKEACITYKGVRFHSKTTTCTLCFLKECCEHKKPSIMQTCKLKRLNMIRWWEKNTISVHEKQVSFLFLNTCIAFHICSWTYPAECNQSSLLPQSGVNVLLCIRTEAAFVLHILKATNLICIHTNRMSLQVYK